LAGTIDDLRNANKIMPPAVTALVFKVLGSSRCRRWRMQLQ
jgi:hypothetical protein